jgi:large subunit ribosomal protein L23
VTNLDRFQRIIEKPLITERASDDMANRNAYHFRVPIDANKVEIRHAVETLFEVKVLGVNTLHASRKWRRRGRSFGQTPRWKKAMVTLAEGDTIEIL